MNNSERIFEGFNKRMGKFIQEEINYLQSIDLTQIERDQAHAFMLEIIKTFVHAGSSFEEQAKKVEEGNCVHELILGANPYVANQYVNLTMRSKRHEGWVNALNKEDLKVLKDSIAEK